MPLVRDVSHPSNPSSVMKAKTPKLARAGFTLTELLVVITIIGLLFALTVGGFTYAQRSAARSKTMATLKAVQSALERYNTEFGEYPEPANPGETIAVGTKTYDVSGAAMLYQALSGDGYDCIRVISPPAGVNPTSDGSIDEAEGKNVMLTDMPKEIWTMQSDRYFIIDGFGRPFQYTKATPIDPSQTASASKQQLTINATYDLWSYGEDEDNTMARSIDVKEDGLIKQASLRWVKNW